MTGQSEVVAVLGASPNPDRYSNLAIKMLIEAGHTVIPIHPLLKAIEGIAVVPQIDQIRQPVDTLTVYVNPDRLEPLLDSIEALKPKRIILNPGTESEIAIERLTAAGIDVVQACSLVLLRTGQW